MTKNTVYSWRVAAERKAQLEEVARRRKRPVAELLDEAVTEWLDRELQSSDDVEQRVRIAAQRCLGSIAGGDPERASEVRDRVREKLQARRR